MPSIFHIFLIFQLFCCLASSQLSIDINYWSVKFAGGLNLRLITGRKVIESLKFSVKVNKMMMMKWRITLPEQQKNEQSEKFAPLFMGFLAHLLSLISEAPKYLLPVWEIETFRRWRNLLNLTIIYEVSLDFYDFPKKQSGESEISKYRNFHLFSSSSTAMHRWVWKWKIQIKSRIVGERIKARNGKKFPHCNKSLKKGREKLLKNFNSPAD